LKQDKRQTHHPNKGASSIAAHITNKAFADKARAASGADWQGMQTEAFELQVTAMLDT
jgi:hypothetical protein